MKIVQAIGSRHRGGAQRFFLRLAEGLDRRGLEQKLAVRRNSWTEQQLKERGLEPVGLRFGGILDFATTFQLGRILWQLQPDAVMTWLERATRRIPRGPWVHIGRLGGYYKLSDYRHCDHLVGNTPGIVNYMIQGGWPSYKVDYIPNFVPLRNEDPVSRSSLCTPEDVPVILWIGRMEPIKGPDIVAKAMQEVKGAHLWLAGDGSFTPKVKQLAGEIGCLDRIHFLGWRDDIHALLKAADIAVLASRFEALGNVILEAWACGVPVVAARSPGPEHLISHGLTGLLVAKDDPSAMAEAFNMLIREPELRHRLGEAGRMHFLRTYSEEAVTSMYMELFARLAQQKAERRKGLFHLRTAHE